MIEIRRIYDLEDTDGMKILIDRLWPRGIKKDKISLWIKEIAPSNELRIWYSHDPEKCKEFKRKYFEELQNKKDLVQEIINYGKKGKVILLYASKAKCNNAEVLLEIINRWQES